MDSYSGRELWADISKNLERHEGKRLGQIILQEFDPRPGGLILPNNKVVKKYDSNRINRILWKIVRGIFFKETGRFLPENTPKVTKILSVNEKPPEIFLKYLAGAESKGDYPGVFDYKFIVFPEHNNFNFWGLLFWDRLITLVGFHDPDCNFHIS